MTMRRHRVPHVCGPVHPVRKCADSESEDSRRGEHNITFTDTLDASGAQVVKSGSGADTAAPSRHQATHRHAGFVVAPKAQTVSAGTYSVVGAEVFVLHYLTT